MWIDLCLQAEEESKLSAQVSELRQELTSERSRTADLQKASQQNQVVLSKLQSDFYGKESEVSALRQDLKVKQQKSPSEKERAFNALLTIVGSPFL